MLAPTIRCCRLLIPFAIAATAIAQNLTITARGYVAEDGSLERGGRVTIADGKIAAVGKDAATDGTTHNYPDGVICAGLIDIDSALSAVSQLAESADPVMPDASAKDALDPFADRLRRAVAAGITTIVLAPDDSNLVGGQAAICATSSRDRDLIDGPLKISLAPSVYRTSFEPSSRAGALNMLRTAIENAKKENADGAMARFANGELPALVTAPYGADVFAAAQFAKDYQTKLIVLHMRDADRVADICGDFAGVVVGPYSLSASDKAAKAAGIFASKKIPVAIAGGTPFAAESSLRFGAAVAARHGLDPKLARRAITSTPAKMLGVDNQIGVIAPNRHADLVVFSGDPLDLRSRVLAVYQSGRLVYRASNDDDAILGDG